VIGHARVRVPVVKVNDKVHPTGISFDMVINNHTGLANSRLLATYAAFDTRARALIFLVPLLQALNSLYLQRVVFADKSAPSFHLPN